MYCTWSNLSKEVVLHFWISFGFRLFPTEKHVFHEMKPWGGISSKVNPFKSLNRQRQHSQGTMGTVHAITTAAAIQVIMRLTEFRARLKVIKNFVSLLETVRFHHFKIWPAGNQKHEHKPKLKSCWICFFTFKAFMFKCSNAEHLGSRHSV